jgi:hypothetical protein
MADAKYYIDRLAKLKGMRQPWESHWQDIRNYVVPDRQSFLGDEKDKQRNRKRLYDTTAETALDVFSSSLVGFLANPAMQWFDIETTDEDLMEQAEVSEWFEKVTKRLLASFNEPAAKFYTSLKMACTDLGAFGTASIYIEEGKRSTLRFSPRNIKELYVAEDDGGDITTVYRELKMSAMQCVMRFGDNTPSNIRKEYEKNKDKEFDIIHAIEPRDSTSPDKAGILNMPYKSVWIDKESQKIILESGFEEFPIPTGRWDLITGDIYGVSPAAKVLPDIKMINQMEKAHILAAEKILNPPLQMPDDGFMGNIDTSPGAVNVYKATIGNNRIEAVNTVGDLNVTLEMMQDKRAAIRSAFYVDQLQLATDAGMTATEVMQRTDEKLRLQSPMIGRVQSELIGPTIERSFYIMFRAGKFPEPPAALEGSDFKVKYVSPMSRAQRSSESDSIMVFMSSVMPLAQVDPSVWDNIDNDEVVRELHDIKSVPSKILRDPKKVAELRETRQQQQEFQQQAQGAQQVADVAKTAKEADLI